VPGEIRDRYDRYLAYVFAEIDGKWVNYNVECVRAGMSPYFMKYGYSQRFHADFVAAEAEARAAKRGIWDPTKQHYPDYDERRTWWTARAEFIARYQPQVDNDPNFIVLTHWDAMKKIEDRVGQEVAILATVGDIKLGDRGRPRSCCRARCSATSRWCSSTRTSSRPAASLRSRASSSSPRAS
jgi:hypothetical protein